ncbi:MAG: hypothetical protein ACE5KE_03490 [Methanosarcinales archaeon]
MMFPTILEEGKEIAKWIEERGVKLISVILFGSAVRRCKEPEDLDVLIIVDGREGEVNDIYKKFQKEVLFNLLKKYSIYPELTIIRKDKVGRGNPSFYYSIIHDGVVIKGNKKLFIDALTKLEGRKSLERAYGMERVYGFMRHAKRDLEEAENVTDIQIAAEGAYRACIEALYVLFRKHGLPIPGNHKEESETLKMLDEIYPSYDLSSKYAEIFEHLHAECFYHGECSEIRKWIAKAEEFIDGISHLLHRC